MRAYGLFTRGLTKLVKSKAGSSAEAAQALDGEASRCLIDLVSLEVRRKHGAFFTSSDLAATATSHGLQGLSKSSLILDPACGAGNLLLAATRSLNVERTLVGTLSKWGERLAGYDIFPEFISATRARIALAALQRGVRNDLESIKQLADLMPMIRLADGLRSQPEFSKTTHLLMNPPFTPMPVPEDCEWSEGKFNTAAYFLCRVFDQCSPDVRLTAILPEVLRSGTRYGNWRQIVERKLKRMRVRMTGVFDSTTDVDIFVLNGTLTNKVSSRRRADWQVPISTRRQEIGSLFTTCVGPVVPHRHPSKGKRQPLLRSLGWRSNGNDAAVGVVQAAQHDR